MPFGRFAKRRGLGSSLGAARQRPTPRTRLPKVPTGMTAPVRGEVEMVQAFTDAFAALDIALAWEQVREELEDGNYMALLDLANWLEWELETTGRILPTFKATIEREGSAALAEVRAGSQAHTAAQVRSGAAPPYVPPVDPGIPAAPSPRSGGFYGSGRFDMTNPFAVARAEASAATLVREVSSSTRRAIKDAVVDSFRNGVTVDELARRLRNTIGLTSRQAASVERYRQSLLDGGMDEDRAEVLTRRFFRKTRNRRAQTIARTEIMMASNQGRIEGWLSAADQGLLDPNTSTKEWITAPENSSYGPPCPSCLPMDGVKVTGVESLFQMPGGKQVSMPPAHPNCRCTAVVWPPEIPDDFEVMDAFV